jgi:hypothetical protein
MRVVRSPSRYRFVDVALKWKQVCLCVGLLSVASCTTETIRPGPRKDASVSDSSNPKQCPADVPDACPRPAPSYASDVVPILEAKCNGCHTGGEGPWPLTNHDDVVHWLAQVLSEVARCTMPPPLSATQLTESERKLLIDWLVCGAPDN